MPTFTPDTSAWLVATKLHPPLRRSDTIRRPRLEEALARSVAGLPLTLLSAPAGYGKTTMLAALPHLLPDQALAWATLDAEDNDPVRFLGLLTAALQRLHPACGRSVWPLLAGGAADGAGIKRAIGALINDMVAALPAPFILVLDDLHFVTEPAVHIALEYLLDHQPPHLHLAVGTRHDPPLRLARLAARRQLAELRRPDLGFRPDEARAWLIDTLGLPLSDAEVAALQERTEGWPAGLCLLAGPLARLGTAADRTQFMAALAHSERYALDFLADEVLRDLPDDLRRFLLQTSVLADMTPSACRAVTGREDAEAVLEGLYRQNLTIASITAEVDGEPVYRHHALFARLLARQLERELPGEVVELHRRAAGAQKTPGRAIAHYLAAGLWEQAAQLMVTSGMQLLHRGMADTVRAWYGALPEETRSAHPRLLVLMGRCAIHRGDYAAAGELLTQARTAFVAAGDSAGEGEALTSLITLTNQNGDRESAAALVERALQLPLNPMGQVAARLARAWIRLADGDWAAIGTDVADALAIPHATGNRQADLIGITYMSAALAAGPGCLQRTEQYCAEAGALAPPDTAWRLGADELSAWVLLWRGRQTEALARAEAAELLRQRLGGYPFVGTDAAVLLAVLQTARGDLKAAGQAVDTLLVRLEGAPRSKWAFYLHAAGRSLALLGRRAEAHAACQRLLHLADDLPLARYLRHHLTGLLALLEGRHTEAAAALNHAAALEVQLPIARVGGSARLLQARLLLEQGRSEALLAAALPVLQEWEQAGTPGFGLLDGPAVQPVLDHVAVRGQGARPLPEGLSQREYDVLRLIVAGRTNRQIGEELYITEETVKSHVVRILRKLDVTSRTQAAMRGRELGL
jgi:LuxR family transcriptional regulator, maltose regulon positive regulatory protein